MKLSLRRYVGAVGLWALLMGLGGCSSSQQEAENLENSEQQSQGYENAEGEEGGNEYANEEGGSEEAGSEEAGNEYANEEGGNEYANENFETENMNTEAYADAGNTYGSNATAENDLQEIVSDMDNGGAANTAAAEPAYDNAIAAPVADSAPVADAAMAAPENIATSGQGGVVGGMSGASAGAGLPEMGSKMPYFVVAGDTLGKISSKLFGTPARWKEIASLSGLDNPNHIFPGDVLYYQLTTESMAYAQSVETITRQEVTVQQGDTLATISSRVYGSSKFWKSIWRQNDQIADPDQLTVGDVVYYVSDVTLAKVESKNSSVSSLVFENVEVENNSVEVLDSLTNNNDKVVNIANIATSAVNG